MSTAQEARQERERQQSLRQAFNQQGELDRGWMREILDTEDLERHLQPNTITKIQALLNKQWVLANLTDAETHDRTFKLGAMRYKILGEHPPDESAIVGPARAFLYNEELEWLQPLTAQERNTIDQIITTMQNMVTRSRGGFERKQINTNIARTESESTKPEENGGRLRGLFS